MRINYILLFILLLPITSAIYWSGGGTAGTSSSGNISGSGVPNQLAYFDSSGTVKGIPTTNYSDPFINIGSKYLRFGTDNDFFAILSSNGQIVFKSRVNNDYGITIDQYDNDLRFRPYSEGQRIQIGVDASEIIPLETYGNITVYNNISANCYKFQDGTTQCSASSGSTFNSTYQTWAYNQTKGINVFNQSLNTSDNVLFNRVWLKSTENFYSGIGEVPLFIWGEDDIEGNFDSSPYAGLFWSDFDNSAQLQLRTEQGNYLDFHAGSIFGDGSQLTGLTGSQISNDLSWSTSGNCPVGKVVVNTTTNGVQCIAVTSGNEFDSIRARIILSNSTYTLTSNSFTGNQNFSFGNLNSWRFINQSNTNFTIYNNSLLLKLSFNNNANIGDNQTDVKDESKYGYNGTCTNNCPITISSGKYDNAKEFNGSNTLYNVGNLPNIVSTMSYSYGAWVKVNKDLVDSNSVHPIFGTGSNTNTINYTFIVLRGGVYNGILFRVGGTNPDLGLNPSSDQSAIINDNGWHHYFATVNCPTGESKLYFDGNLMASGTTTLACRNINSQNTWYVGAPRGGFSQYLNGSVDDLYFFNRTLSSNEVNILYRSTITKLNNSYWNLQSTISAEQGCYIDGIASEVCLGSTSILAKNGNITYTVNNSGSDWYDFSTEIAVTGKRGKTTSFSINKSDGTVCSMNFTGGILTTESTC